MSSFNEQKLTEHAALNRIQVSPELTVNEKQLEKMFTDSSDFVTRKFILENSGTTVLICYMDGLADQRPINETMKVLMLFEGEASSIEVLLEQSLPVSQITKTKKMGDLLHLLMGGEAAVFIDGLDTAVSLGLRGMETRSISQPETEAVIRGPREGFVENLRTNTSLLRRIMKTTQLKMKPLMLGKHTNTDIVLCYMEGIVDPNLLKQVEERIDTIDLPSILESGYLEECIEDSNTSPFPQIQHTQRPDTAAAAVLEGRILIIVDGTPVVMIVPATFWQMLQASEDYYERFQIATLLRILRLFFIFISLTAPAFYIAVITFHQDLLPTTLLLSIASAREPIPFPVIVEALIMEVAFEALREAGIRLPSTIGMAVSILGAIVVGTAAVEAGIVSAPMVIVVAITGIASFTTPHFNAAIAIRMLRFPLMFMAALFGMYGLLIGLMFIMGHMAKLRTFGIPYLAPVGPLYVRDLKDIFIRVPRWMYQQLPVFSTDNTKLDQGSQQSEEQESQPKGELK